MASAWRRADTLAVVVLAALAAGASLQRASHLPPLIYQYQAAGVRTTDVWFDADIPRAACLTTDAWAQQHQITSLHPLISTALYVPSTVLGVGSDPVRRLSWLAALLSGLWTAACFALFRAADHSSGSAALFTLLAAVTSAGMFWGPVPEVHVLAAVTLMLPLIAVGFGMGRGPRDWTVAAASAASLSITVTNWMSGVLAAVRLRGLRRAGALTIYAFVTVSALWLAQALWFPRAVYFVGDRSAVMHMTDRPAPVAVARAFVSHAVVTPLVRVVTEPGYSAIVSVQESEIGSSGKAGVIATGIWLALLGAGAATIARARTAFTDVLVLTLAGQFALHLVVGDETFLFSPNYAPLLVAVASRAAAGTYRAVGFALTAVLIVTAGANNWQQFERAAATMATAAAALTADGALVQPADACR